MEVCDNGLGVPEAKRSGLFALGFRAHAETDRDIEGTGIGLSIVRGAAWLTRRTAYERIAPFAPLFSALVISSIGAWMVAQGFVQQGVAAPAFVVAALTLLAIAAYALGRHGHTHSENAEAHA